MKQRDTQSATSLGRAGVRIADFSQRDCGENSPQRSVGGLPDICSPLLSGGNKVTSQSKARDWKLEYRDLLDAEIEALQLMKWHQEQIDRLERERKARQSRLEAYRERAA